MPFTLLHEPDQRTMFLLNYFQQLARQRARERAIEKAKGKTALDPASAIYGGQEGAKLGYRVGGPWGAIIGGVAGAGLGGWAGKEAKGRAAMAEMAERQREEAAWEQRQRIQQGNLLQRMRERQQGRLRGAALGEGYPSVGDYVADKRAQRTQHQVQSIREMLNNLDRKRIGPRQHAIADGLQNDLFQVLDDEETITDDQRRNMIDTLHKRVSRFWMTLPDKKPPPWAENQGIGQIWQIPSGDWVTRDTKGIPKTLSKASEQGELGLPKDFDKLLKTEGVDDLGEQLSPEKAAHAVIEAEDRRQATQKAYLRKRGEQEEREKVATERAARIAAMPPEARPPRIPVGIPRAHPARREPVLSLLGPKPAAAVQKATAKAMAQSRQQPEQAMAPTADPVEMAQRVVVAYKMNPKSVDREDARKAAKILLDRLLPILEARGTGPTDEEKRQLRELREIAR